ncbi:MAG: glycine cleavage system protein GcvH [Candidatus Obscuribacterales bacterium]
MVDGKDVPSDRKYSTEHTWLCIEGDTARVGITDYAQHQLGDVLFVSVPRSGEKVAFMRKFGEIESVKVASELFSPAAGEIVETNGALDQDPELVNRDPYGGGWLVVIRLSDPSNLEVLFDAVGYEALVARETGRQA